MRLKRTPVEDGVATLTLAQPPLNLLTRALMAEIREALDDLADQPGLRCLLVNAEGAHFSAGADVGEHVPPQHRELIPEVVQTVEAVAAFPLPVVAAVRGRCLGGGFELVQGCDLVVAGMSARFGQPEIALAVTAPVACVLLPRRTTYGTAAELLFTGAPLDATRALAAGLVQHLVPDGQVDERARALAAEIARHSAAALRDTKRTLRVTAYRPRHEALHTAGEIYVEDLMSREDPLEGLGAFLEKRVPEWRHR
jgi:cyclohexa-1,5-dienecarbonyl-CoA hydratase